MTTKEEELEALSLFPLPHYSCHPGDLWRLGEHYLLAGDSTQQETTERLLRAIGEHAAATVSDPPYGEIQASWDTATFGFIPHLKAMTMREATCIFFCSLPFGFDLQREMTGAGWQFRFDQIWHKRNAGFKVSSFQPLVAHEHLFAYTRKESAPTSLTFHGYEAGEQRPSWGDRIKVPADERRQVYSLTSKAFEKRYSHEVREGRKDGARWIRSVLDGRKKQELPEGERTIHPSQKPLELVEKLVLLLTNPGEVVYDPFVGSGTTLLACEKTGRRCVAIEQSPEFCQIVIERWQKYTGGEREPMLLSAST